MMNIFYYKELAQGRWFELSLAEQLANIGSEVNRAAKWQDKDKDIFNSFYLAEKRGVNILI